MDHHNTGGGSWKIPETWLSNLDQYVAKAIYATMIVRQMPITAQSRPERLMVNAPPLLLD